MSNDTDAAGKAFADAAMRGAADYIRQHRLSTEGREHDLVLAIRRHARAAVSQAMADGREAHEAGMDRVAVATAGATMFAAGIEAAKEVLGE